MTLIIDIVGIKSNKPTGEMNMEAMTNQTRMLSRDELFNLAGIRPNGYDEPDYKGASVGKRGRIGSAKYVWGDNLCRVSFTDIAGLRAQAPENVSVVPVKYEFDGKTYTADGKFAIVGDISKKAYDIHSGRYQVFQNKELLDAMAYACEDTSLNVFGHTKEENGKFGGFCNVANPDLHIDMREEYDSPIMLGARVFNSHCGDSTFGVDIYGIRKVCGNYLAMGDLLGKVKVKHFKSESDVVNELGGVLRGFVDKIDVFKDRVHYIRDEPLTENEQKAVLWGMKLTPEQIDNIIGYREVLNPEIKDVATMSAYDLYNATTSFITWRTGSSHMMNSTIALSEKAERFLTDNLDSLIDDGIKAYTKYKEEQDKKDAIIQRVTVTA